LNPHASAEQEVAISMSASPTCKEAHSGLIPRVDSKVVQSEGSLESTIDI
jgi:hypothetical protein